MRIGIDFDNTIAGYDSLFADLAVERGLLEATPLSKRMVRDEIWRREDGAVEWQRLQALAYGERMKDADLLEGVAEFMAECHARGVELHVISHKTQYANYDPNDGDDRVDLRLAALNWMEAKGLFDPARTGLDPSKVHFADTRIDKIAQISRRTVSHFIDDLEEVFAEPSFPLDVSAVLYDPHGVEGTQFESQGRQVVRCRHWQEIKDHVLGATD